PAAALAADAGALLGGRGLVDLVLGHVGIDLADHHAIVLDGARDRDIAVDDVLADAGRIALQRIAQAAAAGRGPRDGIAGLQRHAGEERAQVALALGAGIDPDAVRDRGQPAPQPPGDRALAVAAVGDHRALRL